MRKRIVAKTTILQGEVLTAENITLKRTEQGESAVYWDKVIGSKASNNFVEDEGIVL